MSAVSEAPLARPDDAIDITRVKRVLVVMLRHHGDVLLTTPVYRALKRLNPGLEIDVMVYHATRPLLEHNPDIAMLHSVEKDKSKKNALEKLVAELSFMRTIKSRRFDLLIHLSDHRRGAWLARWIGAPVSIAPRLRAEDAFWRGSFTHFWSSAASVTSGHPLLKRHIVEQHLDALRRLGLEVARAPRLTLIPGAEGERLCDQFLLEQGIKPGYVLIQPTSRWMFKCWSIENNALFIDTLLKRGHQIVLSCGPGASERAMLARIVQQLGGPRQGLALADSPSTLNRLAALIGRARIFVGIDSAPMHMAAAMQTPSVALFGPSGEDNWAPWRGDSNLIAQVLTHPAFACRPCGQDGCGGSKVSQCLVQMPVSQVLAGFDDVLARSDPWLDI
jgi:heptosyltransferase-3